MGAFVTDPFQGVLPGSGLPAGWVAPNGASVTVEPFSAGGPVTPHNWCQFVGEPIATANPGIGSWQETQVSINFFCRIRGNGTFGKFAAAYGTSLVNGQQLELAEIVQEGDGTISVYVAGSPNLLVCNSGSYPFAIPVGPLGVWTYLQINLVTGPDATSGLYNLQAAILANGEEVATGFNTSNFFTSSEINPGGSPPIGPPPTINQVGWNSGFGVSQDLGEPYVLPYSSSAVYPGGIWAIEVTNGGSDYQPTTTTATISGGSGSGSAAVPVVTAGAVTAILFYPGSGYTGTPPVVTITDSSGHGSGATAVATLEPPSIVRISQAPLEIAILPTPANVRVSQAVVELSELPSTARVRIAQAVIEIATLSPPPPPAPCTGLTPNPGTDNSFNLQKVVASFKKPTIRLPVR